MEECRGQTRVSEEIPSKALCSAAALRRFEMTPEEHRTPPDSAEPYSATPKIATGSGRTVGMALRAVRPGDVERAETRYWANTLHSRTARSAIPTVETKAAPVFIMRGGRQPMTTRFHPGAWERTRKIRVICGLSSSPRMKRTAKAAKDRPSHYPTNRRPGMKTKAALIICHPELAKDPTKPDRRYVFLECSRS